MAKKDPVPNKDALPDLIDKSINFDNQNMHRTWPMIKGCLMLIGAVALFIIISTYVFSNFGSFFGG